MPPDYTPGITDEEIEQARAVCFALSRGRSTDYLHDVVPLGAIYYSYMDLADIISRYEYQSYRLGGGHRRSREQAEWLAGMRRSLDVGWRAVAANYEDINFPEAISNGVEYAVEAYFAGVPAEDIIA